MNITRQAFKAFNARIDATFNDAYNAQKRIGSKAEHDALWRIGRDLHGICWDRAAQPIKPQHITAAGHSFA